MALVAAVAAVLLASLVIGSTPDEEEFRFAVLSSWLHIEALSHGRIDFWTPALGLGTPLPFIPNFNLHPLAPLLAVLTPIAWARLLLAVHVVLGTLGMWRLARRLEISVLATAVCVVTYLLATPLQNYAFSDFWPSHVIVWTTMPWLVLIAWRMLDAERGALRFWSVACGLCGGLVLANTNPGHVVIYWPVVLAVAVVHWRGIATRLPWVIVAAGVALAIAGINIVQVLRERALFDPDLSLANLTDPLPVSAIAHAFIAPFGSVDDNLPVTRMLFFGGPFALLALSGCLKEWRRYRELVLIVAICGVLLFTSLVDLPFVSARYQYRDPLVLAAILLAGVMLDRLAAALPVPAAATVGVLQLAAIGLGAWLVIGNAWTPEARRAEWMRGATGAGPAADLLHDAATSPGLLVMSPTLDQEVFNRARFSDGLGVNALAYRGVPVMNGWFKSVSTGALWPEPRMMYGRVIAPQTLLQSDTALDALGIRYVVTNDGEAVAGGLRPRTSIPTGDGRGTLVLYENQDAWPGAFVMDANAPLQLPTLPLAPIFRLGAPPSVMPDTCGNDRFLCRDLTSLGSVATARDVRIRQQGDRIDVQLSPSDRSRLLVVSQMFRDDWVASSAAADLATTRAFGALLAVRVPAGVTAVEIRYRPWPIMIATAVAWITVIGGLLVLVRLRLNVDLRTPSRGVRDDGFRRAQAPVRSPIP